MSPLFDDEEEKQEATVGQRVADKVTSTLVSWRFIIIQSLLMFAWMVINVIVFIHHFDEYPFILLNLLLSTQAVLATPLIMMSQNRQAEKDRKMAQEDLETDLDEELILEQVRAQLDSIMGRLSRQDEVMAELMELTRIRRRGRAHYQPQGNCITVTSTQKMLRNEEKDELVAQVMDGIATGLSSSFPIAPAPPISHEEIIATEEEGMESTEPGIDIYHILDDEEGGSLSS